MLWKEPSLHVYMSSSLPSCRHEFGDALLPAILHRPAVHLCCVLPAVRPGRPGVPGGCAAGVVLTGIS
eukprot:1142257-Pelagomonas_calceolata.AAC.4